MNSVAAADVVIFGGGVAGLWLLNCLRKTGLSAILFESNALGGGQTNKSQGIIHGGMKYALQGVLTNEAQGMFALPDYWRDCLAGIGDIDLAQVPVLSSQQYLFAPSKFTAKITGFLASSTLESKVNALSRTDYPGVFNHPSFKGEVYALNEMVIDVPSLIRELVKENQDAVYKIEPLSENELRFDADGKLICATVYLNGKAIDVSAQQFVFTAGAGNDVLIRRLPTDEVAMQRRPLHMVLVKTPFNYPLYAHCLGMSKRPRMTITTHYTHDGSPVWYLGGAIAENGIDLPSAQQIQATRKELRALFPWLDFTNAEFATLMVDRAEPKQQGGLKPASYYIKTIQNMVIAWPTKLALAPPLANDIMQHFKTQQITRQFLDVRELRAWPMPPLATPVWEEAFCKSVA